MKRTYWAAVLRSGVIVMHSSGGSPAMFRTRHQCRNWISWHYFSAPAKIRPTARKVTITMEAGR